jgi:hypothetical protein
MNGGSIVKSYHVFSVAVVFSLLLGAPNRAVAKPKFKPFIGKWILDHSSLGEYAELLIDGGQRSFVLRLKLDAQLTYSGRVQLKRGSQTVLQLRGSSIFRRIKGTLRIDTETFKVLAAQLTFFDENREKTNMTLAGRATSHPTIERRSTVVLKLKPVRRQIAQTGKAFYIKASALNRGPSGIPNDKAWVGVWLPLGLQNVEVTATNRIDRERCSVFSNGELDSILAGCVTKSLGPGTARKANFTIRFVPPASMYPNGGTINGRVYVSGLQQDNLISVEGVERPLNIKVTK